MTTDKQTVCMASWKATSGVKAGFMLWQVNELTSEPKGWRRPHNAEALQLYQARLKVLAKWFPVTVRVLRQIDTALAGANKIGIKADAVKLDALQRQAVAAWTVEKEKLMGAKNTSLSLDRDLAPILGDAIRRSAKGADALDYELAANWILKGYNAKTAQQVAREAAKATGDKFTTSLVALVTKRRQRLGLRTLRQRGPPERAWR
jgi:hypothetical protein